MTLRILVVHNRYRSAFPSGENQVVDEQVTMLRAAGIEVETYFRSSDEIPDLPLLERVALPLRPIHSPKDTRQLREVMTSFRPSLMHLHNPYPLISPGVIRTAARAGVPIVQTVHNYRHACAAGTLFRAGRQCSVCVTTRLPWPAVAHGCFRGSRAQSLAMAAASLHHRATWRLVSRFLAVSSFVADWLTDFGVPADRVSVLPNALPDPGPPRSLGEGFLFAGRLDPSKGVRLILDAWDRAGVGDTTSLAIAGDGPDRTLVEQAPSQYRGVRYLGLLSPERVGLAMVATAVTVVPSISPETFGRTAVEAFARGRPVLATTVGALGSVVDDQVGWTSPPEPAALAERLALACDLRAAAAKARVARHRYEQRFAPNLIIDRLVETYTNVLWERRSRR